MERNHLIDIARTGAVFVVVIFHALLFQVRIVDGQVQVTPWAAPTWFYPVTWIFMIMPLFFVAGGYANAASIDKAGSFDWFDYLARRGRRLVSPLMNFVAICALVSSIAAAIGYLDLAKQLSAQLTQLLWFMAVYLVIVLFAPIGIRLHDRYSGWPLIALALLALLVDKWSFVADNYEIRNLNLLIVWPLCHQLGIAYQRGWFRNQRLSSPWLAIGFGTTAIMSLIQLGDYPPTAVGFADLPIANVQPPTTAMAALALAQCGVLGILEREGIGQDLSPKKQKYLAVAQGMLVTTYLWHIAAIFIAGAALLILSWLFPTMAGILLSQVTVAGTSLGVVFIIVPWIAQIDYFFIPKASGKHPSIILPAYCALLSGTILVWRSGTVVHPAAPWSTTGVLLLIVGTGLLRLNERSATNRQ